MSLLASTASKLSPKNIKSSVGAVGTELGHLAAATGQLLIPGSAWNDKIKAKAVLEIEQHITEQEEKRDEMERLIEHTTEFVAARLEAENQIGALQFHHLYLFNPAPGMADQCCTLTPEPLSSQVLSFL